MERCRQNTLCSWGSVACQWNVPYSCIIAVLLVNTLNVLFKSPCIKTTVFFLHCKYLSYSRQIKYNLLLFFASLSSMTGKHASLLRHVTKILLKFQQRIVKSFQFTKLFKWRENCKRIRNENLDVVNDMDRSYGYNKKERRKERKKERRKKEKCEIKSLEW